MPNTPDWQPYRGVRASAGSGKTYQLTGHYLRALLTGASPSELLATTFTRKAAGEILDRVLTRLGGACESEEKLRVLASDLMLPGLDAETTRARMKQLCESLDEVSISTIDALFGRLLRGYRHELGLGDGLRMVDESSPEMLRLREAAAADLLAGADAAQVADHLNILAGGEPGRSVVGNLLAWVKRGYELYSTAGAEAWTLDLGVGAPLPEDELDRALIGVEELTKHANGHIRNAVRGNLDSAYAGNWAAFVDKGLAKPLLTDKPVFHNVRLTGPIEGAYWPLIAHAQATIAGEHLLRHFALRDLLALYDSAYRKRREQAGALLFSDVPILLAGVISRQADGGPDYRLGHAARHLLLDEFQDTDPRQYAVLKPFAAGATLANASGEGSLFCVGDVKQSIYGWRGATPQLFDRIERDLPCLAWSDSDISYRSSPAVLDCVNKLFATLQTNAFLSEKAPVVAAEWQRHFHSHTSSRPELPGYVELMQFAADLPDGDGGEADDASDSGDELAEKAGPNLRQAAEKVKAIRDAAPGRSIAVLTRTNEAVRALLPLLAAMGVPAVSESGNPIDDAPAALLALSALTFADHPGDTAARFHLLNSPFAELLQLTGQDALSPPEAALHIRAAVSAHGYAGVIGQWIGALAPHTDRRGMDRLTQLAELADEFDAQRPGWHRPAEFVEWARAQTLNAEPAAAASGDAPVRVMTVHKSKGLEFDAVILPELSKRFLRPQDMVFSRHPATQEIAALTLRPDKAARACCPALAELAQESEHQQTAEALCLLYVALTRARYALHLLVPALEQTLGGKAKASPFSLASIVRAGLAGEDALTNLDLPEALWWCGQADWHDLVPMPNVSSPAPVTVRPVADFAVSDLLPSDWRMGTLPPRKKSLPETASELLGAKPSAASI